MCSGIEFPAYKIPVFTYKKPALAYNAPLCLFSINNLGLQNLNVMRLGAELTATEANNILVPTDRGLQVINVHSIIRVQSISNYSKLFFKNGKTLVVAKVLRWFEERLAAHRFVRIHRTHLVNSGCMRTYNSGNTVEVELVNGEKFAVARRKRSLFLQFIQ